ncbi:MAG: tryptophan--tRNA ligase, partial [Chlamydiia bacterium]|nr:tryptophan--tRNA ligase [Chlamydiia bacterium]
MSDKKRIVSGDRPTGPLHLGHYIGSIQNRVRLQEKYDCYFFIADLHMLTTIGDGALLRSLTLEIAIDYLALGLDPARVTVYRQS